MSDRTTARPVIRYSVKCALAAITLAGTFFAGMRYERVRHTEETDQLRAELLTTEMMLLPPTSELTKRNQSPSVANHLKFVEPPDK